MFAKKLKILRSRKIISFIAIFVLMLIAILYRDLSTNFYLLYSKPLGEISCNYLESGDILPSANTIKLASKSMFFIETTCRGGLDARQACTVESAARSHPDWDINVLFTAPATEETLRTSKALLEPYDNINFYRIHMVKDATGTPLESLIAKGALNRSQYPFSHLSDVMRLLTLYKWGGVYLDLDAVVAKPLGSLSKNWAARESGTSVSSGAMAFSMDELGRRVATAAIRDIGTTFRWDSWGHNGPGVITRVLRNVCSTLEVTEMTAETCNGFEVYGPEYFYPIHWTEAKVYFEAGHIDINKSYVYHVWGHQTRHLKIQRGSPYETLAQKFCPTVYNVNLHKFVTRPGLLGYLFMIIGIS